MQECCFKRYCNFSVSGSRQMLLAKTDVFGFQEVIIKQRKMTRRTLKKCTWKHSVNLMKLILYLFFQLFHICVPFKISRNKIIINLYNCTLLKSSTCIDLNSLFWLLQPFSHSSWKQYTIQAKLYKNRQNHTDYEKKEFCKPPAINSIENIILSKDQRSTCPEVSFTSEDCLMKHSFTHLHNYASHFSWNWIKFNEFCIWLITHLVSLASSVTMKSSSDSE